jgi:hypothetical protein
MSDAANPIGDDEKVVPVMIYTPYQLLWGDLIVKKLIRVGSWLRTNTAPDSIQLVNARSMLAVNPCGPHPAVYPEMHVYVTNILAFHLLPPQQDELDYDPDEPNRKMDPVTAWVGAYRFDGHLRLATRSDLARYVEVTRETFTPMYNIEITNLAHPNLGAMRVNHLLIRHAGTLFSTRQA